MLNKEIIILAIETSCDETGVAVLRQTPSPLSGGSIAVLSQAVASQIDVHKETGGVVPDVAAREHAKVIGPLIKKVVSEAGVQLADMDAIAVTVGPGLMPALVVGVQAAKTLAMVLNKPIIPVHHLEGHITSALLDAEENTKTKTQNPNKLLITNYKLPVPDKTFPALALIVSGGHTMLVEVSGWMQHRVLGQTRDDAAGEAFDKVARLLGLPYPGGPQVSELAEQGNPEAIAFPRPMMQSGDLDFSFSGLKTAVLYELRRHNLVPPDKGGSGGLANEAETPSSSPLSGGRMRADVAASFQAAVVDSLVGKTKQALETPPNLPLSGEGYKALLLTGGVAANTRLRQEMKKIAETENIPLHIAPLWLCGDNAVMIGQAGLVAHARGRSEQWQHIDARARISLEEFSAS